MFSEYHRALFTMHDKHERVAGLHDVHQVLTRDDQDLFWPLFRQVWTGSESLFLNGPALRAMLTKERVCDPNRFTAMEKFELDFIKRSAQRGKPVKVYRGGSVLNHTGFSWTTRRQVAEQFAALSGSSKPSITIGRVPVPNIIMYIGGAESEIIALPEHVDIDTIEDVEPQVTGHALNMRRVQITVQAKGPNALQQLTPAEYFLNEIERGTLSRDAVMEHMLASKKLLGQLGFTSRLKTVESIIDALERD
ncbi:hypothetical protein [Mesorhizobium sp. M8A.F.Ca.ET.021.01.1.1]|uniref:hypothetical protein n=1 Tax=Mesorhizobium sp. M8A.F.Ca.ET.021.01.1.1 TaxID=2496757 RepID=UPI000FD2A35C|nr:hypothetical protein [Mesorhizobium sp. M8A.F.Ca.ET.021.01.1.1]RUW57159.1 hypothetical protein EOA36_00825 [Mesorhizobium sp. M8A.F.Ca.ET.021.01.1.1]